VRFPGRAFSPTPKSRPHHKMHPSTRPIHSPAIVARQQTVNATISRDFAGGDLARETATLQTTVSKSTSTNEGSTVQHVYPAASLYPGQFDDPVNLGISSSMNAGGLMDYQKQLMRLEQQNRKNSMLKQHNEERKNEEKSMLEPQTITNSPSPQPIPKTGNASPPDMEQHSPELKRRRPVNEDDRAAELDESAKRMKQTETGASTQGFPVSGFQLTLRDLSLSTLGERSDNVKHINEGGGRYLNFHV
jgi:hypothetical protein